MSQSIKTLVLSLCLLLTITTAACGSDEGFGSGSTGSTAGSVADPVSVETEELDAETILARAELSFQKADSYRAIVTHETVRNEEVKTTVSTVQVSRNLVARGQISYSWGEQELLFVKGFSYARPTDPPDHAWFEMGRKQLKPIIDLAAAITSIANPELISVTKVNGRRVFELSGDFYDGRSGPPPPREHEYRYIHGATITIDAETMLPITVSGSYRQETVNSTTGEITSATGWSTEASVTDYGQVLFDADHPTDLVPTPSPPGFMPSTPSPTALSSST